MPYKSGCLYYILQLILPTIKTINLSRTLITKKSQNLPNYLRFSWMAKEGHVLHNVIIAFYNSVLACKLFLRCRDTDSPKICISPEKMQNRCLLHILTDTRIFTLPLLRLYTKSSAYLLLHRKICTFFKI